MDPDATGFIEKRMLAQLLENIGLPLGYEADKATDVETFVKSLRLPSYHHFRDYFYMDVILSLCKRVIVIQDLEQKRRTHPRGDPEHHRRNILKELRDLDLNEDMIDSVHKMNKQEKRFKREVLSEEDIKSGVFTHVHEEAARILIQ